MRSPADMQIIQIEITNACNKSCSNCTRFCGNHRKPFFMDYDTFRRAVDSLEGFHGITGIMGGEPTLHPEFERFVLYLRDRFCKRSLENRMIYPQKEFIKEIHRREFEAHRFPDNKEDNHQDKCGKNFKMYGPGLWSNMGNTYPKYYELIQDCFDVQFLNDHINPSYHQPGLVSRKDMGITDEEWCKMRDKCWIQNEWSACITPKGAFFCEIAGALDMLFDGPGGWVIEPGWWMRTPDEFGDQLHWCELCGFALDTFMRDADDETDDVSLTLYNMLKDIKSPKLKAGKINLLRINGGMISNESKASTKGFSEVAAAQPYIEHYEDRFNRSNSQLFVKDYSCSFIETGIGFGTGLNKALQSSEGWILLFLTDIPEKQNKAKEDIDALIKTYILNPGTLHIGEGYVFFSKMSLSLREIGFDRIAHYTSFDQLKEAWQKEKVVYLSDLNEYSKWKRPSIISGKRYAIWGTGLAGGFIADIVLGSGGNLVFAIDIDSGKTEVPFFGCKVHKPEYLYDHAHDYDYLLIGHYSCFDEIFEEAVSIGVEAERIIKPYEI